MMSQAAQVATAVAARTGIVTRIAAVLTGALTIVILMPASALAACEGIRYQVGSASPAEGCAGAAATGAVAVGAVAVSAAFMTAITSYLAGAKSAADVAKATTGYVRGRVEDALELAKTQATARSVAEHPVVTHLRQRGLGTADPVKGIQVPDQHLPAVTAALEGYVRAYGAYEELALRRMDSFSKAFAAGVEPTMDGVDPTKGSKKPTMAGRSGPTGLGIAVARPADVARYAASINHTLPPSPPGRPFLDQAMGGRGMWYASHAEKQQLYLYRDTPMGITMPMCDDCYRFFSNAAQNDDAITGPLVTADRNVIRIFHKDGSVEAYWHNGLRAPDATPGYIRNLAKQGLIP